MNVTWNSIVRKHVCCSTSFRTHAVLVGTLALALTQTASAQTCLQDEYGKNVQCTANDVRIAFATNPRGLDGTPKPTCIAGQTFSFVADFHVTTTATARENIGMFFATGGQANALKGTCADNIIAPIHQSANPLDTVPLGTSQYLSADPPPDTCGDISTADNNQVITVEVDNVDCKAGSNGMLALPNCTSWQQPGGTIQCVSNPPNYPWVKAAIPGSPSKCNCDDTFTVPIAVQTPGVTVAKSCNTSISTGTGLTSCDAGAEGSQVTYTIAITNQSNFGTVAIDQICDSAYGTLFRASGFTGAACPAGSVGGTISNNTCSATSTTCSFVVTQGENLTVKNIVSVVGHGSSGGTSFGPTASNEVTVTSSDAPSTATVTKTLVNTTNACLTVRYGVDVQNTSSADEAVSLSALNDSAFGDLTTVHDNVLGTTCGVATGNPGLGTLSGSSGAGALSGGLSLAGGGTHYVCQFDAQFCGGLGTISLPNNTTCNGVKHTNQVSGTLTGDEGEKVTQTPGSLTVNECVAASVQ
jgi:hypothetical protein